MASFASSATTCGARKHAWTNKTEDFVQFLLDPSVVPLVISDVQKKNYTLDKVFSLTRTFCYGIHRRRLHLLGRFNYF